MFRVSCEVALRDEATKRRAEHDRLLDAEGVAQVHHVVGPRVEVPLGRIVTVAAALPAVVVEQQLGDVTQLRQRRRLEHRVVGARTAVEEDDGGALAHRRSVGDETGPVDIDEQPDATTDVDLHGRDGSDGAGPGAVVVVVGGGAVVVVSGGGAVVVVVDGGGVSWSPPSTM